MELEKLLLVELANCGTTFGCLLVLVVNGLLELEAFSILNEVLRKIVVKTKGCLVVL